MGRTLLRLLIVPAVLFSAACIWPLSQWSEEITFHPKNVSFQPSLLKDQELAVLSAVVGFGLEGYAHQVSRSLSNVLTRSAPPLKTVAVHEALNRINREGLAVEYASMMSDYARTGILNRAVLEKIGRALHVTYIFQPSLASFTQFTSGRLSILGLRLLQTRITTLRLTLQLWDTRTGEIVWESSGEATLAGEDVREARIPFDEIAQRLWTHMLESLPIGLPLITSVHGGPFSS